MRDDVGPGPLTPGSGRMGPKDPAGISGCNVRTVADVGVDRPVGTTGAWAGAMP